MLALNVYLLIFQGLLFSRLIIKQFPLDHQKQLLGMENVSHVIFTQLPFLLHFKCCKWAGMCSYVKMGTPPLINACNDFPLHVIADEGHFYFQITVLLILGSVF